MIPLVDTHTHLTDSRFDADLESVLERALAAGVRRIVVVSETLEEAQSAVQLAQDHALLVPAAGLFPTHLDLAHAERVCAFARAHTGELVAIGEVGLDYWKVKEPADREVQREILKGFARLATELSLPLNIHSRSAGHYTIDLLLECGCKQVQMHAFDGKASHALRAVEAGFFFSIPSSVVRSPQKQKLVKRLPLSHLLLETDSPVLGPDREQRNEPANVRVALDAVAQIKGLPPVAVAEAVLENTRRLYGASIV